MHSLRDKSSSLSPSIPEKLSYLFFLLKRMDVEELKTSPIPSHPAGEDRSGSASQSLHERKLQKVVG
jgi:hypothetical protein